MINHNKLLASNLSVCMFVNKGEDTDIKQDYILRYMEHQDSGELLTRRMFISIENIQLKPILVEESFNHYATKNGFGGVIQEEYDILTLTNIINAIKVASDIKEEEKVKYNTMIEKTVEWWCNKLSNPQINKEYDGNISSIWKNAPDDKVPYNTKEVIEKFKYYLTGEIKVGLYNNPNSFKMTVDYGPDIYLQRAALKAGLMTQFPRNITMFLSGFNVNVNCDSTFQYETIYSGEQIVEEKPKEKGLCLLSEPYLGHFK